MPDVYISIAGQPEPVIDAIAASMDTRAADPAMGAICAAYMAHLPHPGAEILEIGCGNGASTEHVRANLAPARLTGIDPSPGLLARARRRFEGAEGIAFAAGDAAATGADDASADIVIAHTVYSHLTDPGAALAEALRVLRVLRPGGRLAVFDGDYASNTVALFAGDPLQAALAAVERHMIHAPYVMRSLPRLARAAGFAVERTDAHGYVCTGSPDYLLGLIGRGMDAALAAGEIGAELAHGFRREALRRAAEGSFYGAILFVSVVLRKPH